MGVVVRRTRIEGGRVVEEPIVEHVDAEGRRWEREYRTLEAAKRAHGHECGVMYVRLDEE